MGTFNDDIPAPRWLARPDPHDVVCAVKRFVSDGSFSQEPLVVMPSCGVQRLPTPCPTGRVPRVHSPEKADQWRKLLSVVELLAATHLTYRRAFVYVNELASGNADQDASLVDLPWHSSPAALPMGPIALPVCLQGALAPQMKFEIRWR